MAASGLPWGAAASLAWLATLTGHALAYGFFRLSGKGLMAVALRLMPPAEASLDRLRGLLAGADRRAVPTGALLALRWVGLGYAQLFWLMGAFRLGTARVALFLAVNDLVWAAVWAYGLVTLRLAAPTLSRWILAVAWLSLLATAAVAVWRIWENRGKRGTPRE